MINNITFNVFHYFCTMENKIVLYPYKISEQINTFDFKVVRTKCLSCLYIINENVFSSFRTILELFLDYRKTIRSKIHLCLRYVYVEIKYRLHGLNFYKSLILTYFLYIINVKWLTFTTFIAESCSMF